MIAVGNLDQGMRQPGLNRQVGYGLDVTGLAIDDLPDIKAFACQSQRGNLYWRFWDLRIILIKGSCCGTSTIAPSGVIQS